MSIAYRTLTIENDEVVEIGTYDSLEDAVSDTREMWMEDHSPCLILVEQWPSRNPVATMARVAGDPELCITCYLQEFRMETHRCHYVLNESGGYERTEVSELVAPPAE